MWKSNSRTVDRPASPRERARAGLTPRIVRRGASRSSVLGRLEAEDHHAAAQLVARADLGGDAGVQALAVQERAVHGADLLAEEVLAAAAVDLGVTAADGALGVHRGEVDVRVDPGHRVLAADGGLGAVREIELHARRGVHQPLRPIGRHLDVGPGQLAGGDLGAHDRAQQIVRLAQPPGELAHHAHGDLGIAPQELVEGGAVDLQQADVRRRPRRGGPGQVLEHRHLAEEVPLLQHGEDLLLVADLVEDLHLARVDDVHLRPQLALAEDVIPRLELEGVALLAAAACNGGFAAAAGRLENRVGHRPYPSPSTSREPRPSSRAGSPSGSVQLGAKCPLDSPHATGQEKPATPPPTSARQSRASPSGFWPFAIGPFPIWPTIMPAMFARLPDSPRWVNMRSILWGGSLTSSQKTR